VLLWYSEKDMRATVDVHVTGDNFSEL
jgi:hypothetical protein